MHPTNPEQKLTAGETVIITKTESPKYDEIGEYVGLANTHPDLPRKHRINFAGEIYIFYADDFDLA